MDADDLLHRGDVARHAAAAPEQARDGQGDAPPSKLLAVEAAPAAGGHLRADPLAGVRDPWRGQQAAGRASAVGAAADRHGGDMPASIEAAGGTATPGSFPSIP
eukprot:5475617-Pyramimonas_sp.AAC.1